MDTLNFVLNKCRDANRIQWSNEKWIKEASSPIELANVSRLDLVQWFRQLDFKVGVEVGVAHAEFSKLLAYLNYQMIVYGVDPYTRYSGYHDYTRTETFKRMKEEAELRMRPYPNFKFVEKFSMEAVKDFKDESLDFVYIDANHEEPFVTEDIAEWSKKVRKGGIVAGHDYIERKDGHVDVKDAIHKYCSANNIPLLVLGRSAITAGEVREKVRSWMFVK